MNLDSTDNSFAYRSKIVINGRFRVQRISGVQRYAHEITQRMPSIHRVITPTSGKGTVGHLWEQTVLPALCGGRMLWSPNACGPLAYANQVVTFHDLFPLEHPEWYSRSYAAWYGITMRRLARCAKHIVAVSGYTKSRLVNHLGVDPDRVTVVHNGCHLRGPASADAVAEAATALKLPTRRYVLSLSSMEQRKNTSATLAAWGAIYDRLPEDTWLVLAGPPADTSVYGRRLSEETHPRVFYTGYVPEQHLAGLYTGASLFVFPSLAEGFGFPLLEAMACGVPCISSNSSSLPEVGGDLVDYVNPHDAADLGRLMLARLTGRNERCAPFLPGIEHARSFSWEAAAHNTLQILQAASVMQPVFGAPVNGRFL
jgi:glycosyltransferase involved in cell wall biosynthesis